MSLAAAVLVSQPAAARPLHLGFFDPVLGDPGPTGQAWRTTAQTAGSDTARLIVQWGAIAPRRPDSPSDPRDPAYNWGATDDAIRALASTDQLLLLNLTGPPEWSRSSEPVGGYDNAWDPDPEAYGAFAEALALRYSGRYPDPDRPESALPRVRYWQAFNEPNLQSNLNPQWRDGKPYSPQLYRKLLNRMFDAVKSVQHDNKVVTAGMGPFGDPRPGGRLMPVRFWREMLKRKTRFDIWSHHPYGVREPSSPALNGDDATIPDIYKIRRVIESARKRGTLVSRRRPPSWITEISYDSSPPDPDGVPAQTHARWLEQAFYILWKQGVSRITWFRIVDQEPVPSFGATNQSGIFLTDGTPKPAATAFRFPFVAERVGRREVRLWGRAPEGGTLVVSRRVRGQWVALERLQVKRHEVFDRRTTLVGNVALKASVGSSDSLVWRLGRDG